MNHLQKAKQGCLGSNEPCNICKNKLWCIKNKYKCQGYVELHNLNDISISEVKKIK